MRIYLFSSLFLCKAVFSQQPGNSIPEVHPQLYTQRCTRSRGCLIANTSVVLESSQRWLHTTAGANCLTANGFDRKICPNPDTCGKACVLEAADYQKKGITTNGNRLTLNLFDRSDNDAKHVSPRVLLFDETAGRYAVFKLFNQEFSFDVDVSKAPCGSNGALYLVEMDSTGHRDAINRAGAKYGTGYCNVQCPKANFIKGRVSLQ
jgi:cellulose 1,4-beta-cellobiosidase